MDNNFPDKYKNILVTGGAGFIGGALIRNLLKNPLLKIFNLDKLGYASDLSSIEETIKSIPNFSKDQYKFLHTDLVNYKDTVEAINFANPDLVINLAAESHVDRSIDSPQVFIESNIFGTYNLLEAVRGHWEKLNISRKESFRFHHISTDEVFGSLSNLGKFAEDTKYDPRSPYSASKASSDHLVRAWYHTFGLPIVITNCSNNYGPWQFPEKLIPMTILKAIAKKSIPLYGDGSNVRDWLFVEDHIEAIILCAAYGEVGESYCIGGNSDLTNKDVLEQICKFLDEEHDNNFSHCELISNVKDRPGHDKRYAIDASKIQNKLGWLPKHDFKTGLHKTIKWYLKNLSWTTSIQKKSGYVGQRLGLKN